MNLSLIQKINVGAFKPPLNKNKYVKDMRVLWLTYTVFPEARELYTGNRGQKGSGGWIFSAADELLNVNSDIELSVAIVSSLFSKYTSMKGERIQYYMIPVGKGFINYNHGYDKYWQDITTEFKPDIVHVHGIESSLGLSYIRVCGNQNVVCSIQGLPDIIARYLMHGLSRKEMLKTITFRDVVRLHTYFDIVKNDARKEKMVHAAMNECKYFIGRTDWDRAHLWAVNPNANYFFCNETLRTAFYERKWEYKKATPHTIFISAMKGLHIFLQALPLVAREYPDVKVFVATGGNLVEDNFKSRLLKTGYENMIKKRICKYGISGHIKFLGHLNEEEMLKQYLAANVFVCSSTCENSSNSVGEAQLLGVPIVASYVGGMANIIPSSACGVMYRSEEYEMMAKLICETFENSPTFDNKIMREIAHKRHDPHNNALETVNIYRRILNM